MSSKPQPQFTLWNPVTLMFVGGVSVLLGIFLADQEYGDACQESPEQTDDLMDVLGNSVYAEITGPFPVDRNQSEYIDCVLSGHFEVGDVSGTCEDLNQAGLLNRQTTPGHVSFSWDLSACRPFITDEEHAKFLNKRTVHVRKHTTDLPDILHGLCSEDAAFLRILARHLPTDRPLLALDAGAHVGAETLLLSRFARFTGKILAVEPHPASAALLRANVDRHPHYVTRIQAALTAADTAAAQPQLQLTGAAARFSGWHVQHGPGGQAGPVAIDVPSITLRRALDLTRSKKFDVIKLDIAGEEAALMREPASRAILCQATCLAATVDGVAQEQYNSLLESGCPSSHPLVEVGTAGRYRVLCQEKTAQAARARQGTVQQWGAARAQQAKVVGGQEHSNEQL
eukprot:jgi/Ulvmu1/9639/UM054_0071.1